MKCERCGCDLTEPVDPLGCHPLPHSMSGCIAALRARLTAAETTIENLREDLNEAEEEMGEA